MTDPANAASREAQADVVQNDREWAAQTVPDDGSHSSYMAINAIVEGRADDWPLVQAFARYRLALADEAASQPRIAEIKWQRMVHELEEAQSWCGNHEDGADDPLFQFQGTLLDAANIIRSLAALHDTAPTDQAQKRVGHQDHVSWAIYTAVGDAESMDEVRRLIDADIAARALRAQGSADQAQRGGEVERIQRALAELDGKNWTEHRRALHVAAALAQSGKGAE